MKDVEYKYMRERFLPICRQDMKDRGWDRVDFVYITGDAYVDHPSFGPAVITRLLESRGYRIGIISQPDWKDNTSIMEYGEPKLGFLISGGNMDSMVNHYSVSKKRSFFCNAFLSFSLWTVRSITEYFPLQNIIISSS